MKIKLTNLDDTTMSGMKWGENITNSLPNLLFADDINLLCSENVIHYYPNEYMAELMRYNHGYENEIKAWACYSNLEIDGITKCGTNKLTTLETNTLPEIKLGKRIYILCFFIKNLDCIQINELVDDFFNDKLIHKNYDYINFYNIIPNNDFSFYLYRSIYNILFEYRNLIEKNNFHQSLNKVFDLRQPLLNLTMERDLKYKIAIIIQAIISFFIETNQIHKARKLYSIINEAMNPNMIQLA